MLCALLLINCNSRSGSRIRHSKMFDAELCDAVSQRVAAAGLQDDVIVVGHVVPFVATTHFAAASCLGRLRSRAAREFCSVLFLRASAPELILVRFSRWAIRVCWGR